MKPLLKNFFIALFLTVLCILFLVDDSYSIMGWLCVLLFGFATVLYFLKLVFPNAPWLKWLKLPKEPDNRPFEEIYNDTGIFEYAEDGFTVYFEKDTLAIKWSEVKTMLGYKRDLFAYDSICLDVFCDNDKVFTINEETKGWFQFVVRSKDRFPEIDKTWEITITDPAFETKLTLIYDRDKRNLEEVLRELQTG